MTNARAVTAASAGASAFAAGAYGLRESGESAPVTTPAIRVTQAFGEVIGQRHNAIRVTQSFSEIIHAVA